MEDPRGGGEIGGPGGAEQDNPSPRVIVGQAVGDVGPAAAEVGAVQQIGAVRAEDGHHRVADAIGEDVHGGLDGIGGGGVTGGKGHGTADERSVRTIAGRGAEVVACAARIGRKGDLRIKDQGSVEVVFAHFEPDFLSVDEVAAGHLVDVPIIAPLKGKGCRQLGREFPVRIVLGVLEEQCPARTHGGGHATVAPRNVAGVGARCHGEFEGRPSLTGAAPTQSDAGPDILRLEHGHGLHVLGPLLRIVREVEVLAVRSESAAHPIQGGQGIGIHPLGLPQDALSGPDVVVFGLLVFGGPLPTRPTAALQLDATPHDVRPVVNVLGPLALIGHKSDLGGEGPRRQQTDDHARAHHGTNKFGNRIVAAGVEGTQWMLSARMRISMEGAIFS